MRCIHIPTSTTQDGASGLVLSPLEGSGPLPSSLRVRASMPNRLHLVPCGCAAELEHDLAPVVGQAEARKVLCSLAFQP